MRILIILTISTLLSTQNFAHNIHNGGQLLQKVSNFNEEAKLSDSELIQLALEERMLSQRLAKNFILMGTEFSYKDVVEFEFESDMHTFEKNMQKLIKLSPDEEISMEYQKMKFIWSYYKQILKSKNVKSTVPVVIDYSNRLLDATEYSIKLISKKTKVKRSKLMIAAGKCQMITQRIALLLLANKWEVRYDKMETLYDENKQAFKKNLKYMYFNKGNTKGTKLYLKLIVNHFRHNKKDLVLDKLDDMSADDIYILTQEVLDKLRLLEKLYSEMNKKRTKRIAVK